MIVIIHLALAFVSFIVLLALAFWGVRKLWSSMKKP